MDTASMAREQVFGAIRAFTSATVAEAEVIRQAETLEEALRGL